MLTRTKEKSMIWSHAMLFALFILFINVDAVSDEIKFCGNPVWCFKESDKSFINAVNKKCTNCETKDEIFELIGSVQLQIETEAEKQSFNNLKSTSGLFVIAFVLFCIVLYLWHTKVYSGRAFFGLFMCIVIMCILIQTRFYYNTKRVSACKKLENDMQRLQKILIQEIDQQSKLAAVEEMEIKGNEIGTETEEMIDYSSNKIDDTQSESVPTTSIAYSETGAAFNEEDKDSNILEKINVPPSETAPETIKPAKPAKSAKSEVNQPKKVPEETDEIIADTDSENYAVVCMVIGIVFCYVLYAYVKEPNTEEDAVNSV